jgi:hypothetical protein
VKAKVSHGNETGIHLPVKATKRNLAAFVFLSSLKESQPGEPTKAKAWRQSLEVLEAIMVSVLQTVQIKTFLKWSASPETLSLKLIIPA